MHARLAAQTAPTVGTWETRGFDAFRKGTFGNAGQNLYVSRAGVLQRIHQYDVNGDGYVDLLFSNSQDHWERPPTYFYQFTGADVSRQELPALGASCATVADLRGTGQTDLVIGPRYDGIGFDLNATIYYGPAPSDRSDRPWGEHAVQYLPASFSSSVAAGDFDGDGRVDLAFQCRDHLRLFPQTELGFMPKRFVDLPVQASRIAADDLDGDGCADVVARFADGSTRIYWGGPGGIDPGRFTVVAPPGPAVQRPSAGQAQELASIIEWVEDAVPLPKVLRIGGQRYVFVARPDAVLLYPVAGRQVGEPMRVACREAYSAAAADLDGDGREELILACRDAGADGTGGEASWIYWNGDGGSGGGGFGNDARTRLPTARACELAVGTVGGRTCIAVCQRFNGGDFSVPAPLFRLDGRRAELWRDLPSHDPCGIFAVRDGVLVVNRRGRDKYGRIPVSIYLGSAGGFAPERRIQLPAWGVCVSVCADLDDDGRVDVAMANASENCIDLDPGSYVYFQKPDGFPAAPSQVLPTKRAHGIACADLDRDGYLDLVFAGFSNDELLIFRGSPTGFDLDHPTRVTLHSGGEPINQPRFIYLADLNHDGWLDLVIPSINREYSVILWGGPEGFSSDRQQRLNAWHCCSCRAADLDGDGWLDLVIGGHLASASGPHDSFVHIYWNGPDGLREDRRTLLPSEAVNSISIADFNNDGNLDVFVGSYGDGRKRRDIDSYIYWNRGGRGFSAADFTRLFNHSASGDFAADFNEDGWIDLAVANHKPYGDHNGLSRVWWNGPDGFDEKHITYLPTEGPHGMVTPAHGNIMDRSMEEHYLSEPYELPPGARVSGIEWEGRLGPKTWVTAQLRTAASRHELAHAAWSEPGTLPAGGPWVQYRLALGATNCGSTPRVTAVRVSYVCG